VRCGAGVGSIEDLARSLGLDLTPSTDGGAPADGGVLGFDFWRATAGDQGTEVFLKGTEWDEVVVGEEA